MIKTSPKVSHFSALITLLCRLDLQNTDENYIVEHSRIFIAFQDRYCYFPCLKLLFLLFPIQFFLSPQNLPEMESIFPRYLSQKNGKIFTPVARVFCTLNFNVLMNSNSTLQSCTCSPFQTSPEAFKIHVFQYSRRWGDTGKEQQCWCNHSQQTQGSQCTEPIHDQENLPSTSGKYI